MLRRGLIVTGLGMSLSLAGAGLVGGLPALAQESSEPTEATAEVDHEAEMQAHYEDFLARFAENLGLSDPALVETAFKDTLKEMVDARFEEGEISANLADELKTRIDEAEGPFLIGGPFGGPFGEPFGGERNVRIVGRDHHSHGHGHFIVDGGPGLHEGRGIHIFERWGDVPAVPAVGGEVESQPATDKPTTDEAESTPST